MSRAAAALRSLWRRGSIFAGEMVPPPGHAFRSLRTRLLAAFIFVILLTLISAGSAVVWVVQSYRTRIDVENLSDSAFAGAMSARNLERQEARPDEIAAFVANLVSRPNARVLVVDSQDRVLAERTVSPGSEPSFAGRRVVFPPADALAATPEARQRSGRGTPNSRISVWRDTTEGVGRPYLMISASVAQPSGSSAPTDSRPDARNDGIERFLARQPAYRIVLALPERNLASAWRELAPSLASAAVLVLPASMAVAWWLARSITRRLGRITTAARAIARGDLHQSIPDEGGDEVAELAAAFNMMSREVAASHRQLREFVANASHELRTPLTSIQGFSQALLDGALPGPDGAEQAGHIIFEESGRMRRLVEDLLYLSKVEAAGQAASRQAVDVAALLREELRRLRPAAQHRDQRVEATIAELPGVLGDRDQLDRLFGNLIDNARKYTPAGETIRLRAWVDAGALHVDVHNTGSCIPAEDLPHVFERFYRVDKSRARSRTEVRGSVEGSGLGLAIAQEVAERHGGRIIAASDPATGTSFRVTLPLALPSERLAPARTAPPVFSPVSAPSAVTA